MNEKTGPRLETRPQNRVWRLSRFRFVLPENRPDFDFKWVIVIHFQNLILYPKDFSTTFQAVAETTHNGQKHLSLYNYLLKSNFHSGSRLKSSTKCRWELCKQLVQLLFSGKDKRVYTMTAIKGVPPLCISYINGTSCEREPVEAVESTHELVCCSAHLHQREVSQDGSTAWCIQTFIHLLSGDNSPIWDQKPGLTFLRS